MMNSFFYLFKGFGMLTRRGLRRYVIVPFIVNILVFIGLIWFGAHYFEKLTNWIVSFLPGWLAWLSVFLWVLFAFASLIIIIYTFTLIANLIASPFNALLSEKVEFMVTGKKIESSGGTWSLVKDIPRSLLRQLQYILYYLLRAILVLVLFIIPVVNVIATPFWFALNAWMMSVQYMDYPMDNHRVTFKTMRRQLAAKRVENFSFGSAVMLVSMIPIVNFAVMPAAVIGATLMWCDHYRH